jgi:hypothetical protein
VCRFASLQVYTSIERLLAREKEKPGAQVVRRSFDKLRSLPLAEHRDQVADETTGARWQLQIPLSKNNIIGTSLSAIPFWYMLAPLHCADASELALLSHFVSSMKAPLHQTTQT